MAKSAVSLNPTRDDFESLLAESYSDNPATEGSVVKGRVVNIENDFAIIDVGLKTEGKIALKEFAQPGKNPELKVGDTVEVYLERIENAMGEAVLSRDKAKREEAWTRLEQMSNKNERVDGVIFGRVKGGFTVDLGGAVAFLPGSGRRPPDPRRGPADERLAALPDPQDGPPPRQHRGVAPRHHGRDPRRAALRTRPEPRRRPGGRGHGQEHHRLRRVR